MAHFHSPRPEHCSSSPTPVPHLVTPVPHLVPSALWVRAWHGPAVAAPGQAEPLQAANTGCTCTLLVPYADACWYMLLSVLVPKCADCELPHRINHQCARLCKWGSCLHKSSDSATVAAANTIPMMWAGRFRRMRGCAQYDCKTPTNRQELAVWAMHLHMDALSHIMFQCSLCQDNHWPINHVVGMVHS
jgi:hypothetical protein